MDFTDIVRRYGPLSPQCVDALERRAVKRCYPAGGVMLRQGVVCDVFFCLSDGLARVCHHNGHQEATQLFCCPGDIYTPVHCWHSGVSSPFSLVAIEPTEMYTVSYEVMRRGMLLFPELKDWLLALSAGQLYALERRYLKFANMNAADRLRAFMTNDDPPLGQMSAREIAQRIPLKHIASYLGIRPEHLSRLRRQR